MENNSISVTHHEQSANATKELKLLYEEYYLYLLEFLRQNNAFKRNVSFPLLIKPFPEYFNSTTRLMIIGQETQGWSMSPNVKGIKDEVNGDRVHSLMMLYKNVRQEKGRKSPFWRFAHKLNKEFNSTNEAFIWNNISKVDEAWKTPKWDIFHGSSSKSSHPIINKEFQILKPNVVVFTTGVKCDNCIRSVFQGVKIEPINEIISLVKHELLPPHSYKTEHPTTLSFRNHFDRVIEFISFEVKSKGLNS